MKQFWKIVGIAALVGILGVAAVGAVAFAQDDGSSTPFDLAARFKEALAAVLGISVDDYDAAVDKAQDQVVADALAEGWLTEEQAQSLQERMDRAQDSGMGFMGRGFDGMGRGFDGMDRGAKGGSSRLLSAAAEALGMTTDDLCTEMEAGKSIADLAAEKGVDTQVIIDAYLDKVKADLDAAVAEGSITQNQADYQLQQAEERAVDRLDSTGLEGRRGGRHHGAPPDATDTDTDEL
ncbi:MAG: hypothetical protein JXA93_14820 [Anaerolineae bacterium]|nr:hypothetical protein [Anaerolineae bacterium]